jgi:flagellar basal body-associated protein FliL
LSPLSEQPFSLRDLSLAVIIVIIVTAFLGVIIIVAAFLGQQVFPEEQPPSTSSTARAPSILGPTASSAAVPLR